jgi:hypothetical protein
MQPLTHAATMATRDLASSFTTGDWALPQGVHALLFFLQEDGGEQSHCPQLQHGRRAHQRSMIQAQFLFAIAEEHLDVPPSREMREQRLGGRLQVAGASKEWRTITI